MSAQVAQVFFISLFPVRAHVRGQYLPTLSKITHAPWSMLTGTLHNEYYRRKRPGRRLSKIPWTLHRPYKRTRNRLRTIVPIT
jgi:hypothetical protein